MSRDRERDGEGSRPLLPFFGQATQKEPSVLSLNAAEQSSVSLSERFRSLLSVRFFESDTGKIAVVWLLEVESRRDGWLQQRFKDLNPGKCDVRNASKLVLVLG